MDIHKEKKEDFKAIQFADPCACAATHIVNAKGYVFLASEYMSASDIATADDARNLIKALEKALVLGWWND